MNPNVKIIVIAIVSAVVGGGLVVTGVKLAAPSQPAASKHMAVQADDSADVVADDERAAPAEQPAKTAPKVAAGTKTAPKPTANVGAGAGVGANVGASAGTGSAGAGAAAAPSAGSSADAQARALLLSSPWCSFSYNSYSGSSSTTRYVYNANGTFSIGGRGETYSSGSGGTYAGQSDTSGGGQWKISGGQLYVATAETGNQFVAVPATVTQNSNGYPIITAGGVEYTQCN